MGCVERPDLIGAAHDQKHAIVRNAQANAAINTALALWQRNSRNSIIGMQEDISKRKQKLADYIHDHAKKFWSYEKDIVDDAFAESHHDPQRDAIANEWRMIAKENMNAGRSTWINEMHRRCLSPTRCEDARWKREDQRTRTDLVSFGDRHAENRAESMNDQRYARQYAALGMGKNILNNVKTFQNLFGFAGGNAAAMLSDTINSARTALGYTMTVPDRRPDGWGAGATQKAWHFENEIWRTNNTVDDDVSKSGAPYRVSRR